MSKGMSRPERDPDLDLGTAGASARREGERRRAARERRVRERHPRVGGLLLALGGEPVHEQVWERGARGEERLAASLAKRCQNGVLVLHDRRMPGGRANIDHLAVAPSGVWVIDAKRYRGRVAVSAPLFGRAKLMIAGRAKSALADGLAKQVDAVRACVNEHRNDVPVHGAMCFIDGDLPILRTLTFQGWPLLHLKALAKRLNATGLLDATSIRDLASSLAQHLPPA
jgi:Nuclease-related domain